MDSFKEFEIDYNLLNFNFVNFTVSSISSVKEETLVEPKYNKEYEDRTTEYYKTLRFRKMDPLINIDLEDDNSFKFKYTWDPYTGERKESDPYGPLYFDPDSLIHYYYINRLKNLWNEPVDETGGYYEGYYDMLVGSGENINIVGRGECPEKYLFRIPIIDCYLEKDYNKSIITMGPRLTDDEAKEIDRIAQKNPSNYKQMFRKNRPSLYEMKKLYDEAINLNPSINLISKHNYSEEEIKELKYKANCKAVDKLKSM
jgi:hypothetical protein